MTNSTTEAPEVSATYDHEQVIAKLGAQAAAAVVEIAKLESAVTQLVAALGEAHAALRRYEEAANAEIVDGSLVAAH